MKCMKKTECLRWRKQIIIAKVWEVLVYNVKNIKMKDLIFGQNWVNLPRVIMFTKITVYTVKFS